MGWVEPLKDLAVGYVRSSWSGGHDVMWGEVLSIVIEFQLR